MLDELNIMRILFRDQRKVIKTMDGIVKSRTSEELVDDTRTEDSEGFRALSTDSSQSESRPQDEEGARYIWGSRGDPDEFSFPLSMVMTSLEEINAMIQRAEKAEQAV